jgi:hypothetical protein
MKEYLYVGPVPSEEDCAQVGSPDYATKGKQECRMFREQIRRHYPEPDNGYLAIKSNSHDYGTYYEVVAVYDMDCEEAANWAFDVEGDTKGELRRWDKEAQEQLVHALLPA